MRRRAAVAPSCVLLALACGRILPDQAADGPTNSCPAHPCTEYTQPGAAPTCNGGICLVAAPFFDLVAVIALPEDSYFAPSRTLAVPVSQLVSSPSPTCAPPCARLPDIARVTGSYQVLKPSDAVSVGWDLGNAGSTVLPIQATFRFLWAESSGSFVDAAGIGLPVGPITAQQTVSAPGSVSGPAGGPVLGFEAYFLAGTYERTLSPQPPFDQAFPPDIDTVTIPAAVQTQDVPMTLDFTTGTDPMGTSESPTFNISRVQGLDGWTAQLRDATTLRPLSPVAHLSGVVDRGVTLVTNHHSGDALTNAQLVMTPPTGQGIPIEIRTATANVIPQTETMADLPPPVTVTGTMQRVDQTNQPGTFVFEAQSICRFDPTSGAFVLDKRNFEFTARGATGSPVLLPGGTYRLTARPDDAASPVSAVSIDANFVVDSPCAPPGTGVRGAFPVTLGIPQPVVGQARVSDGRPLAGAIVEALPQDCFQLPTTADCLPRAGQTTTGADGAFPPDAAHPFALDPGGYVLRVRPADGTRLPWMVQSLVVLQSTTVQVQDVGRIVVPAPVSAGLQLVDPTENPIVDAVVRMFEIPASGRAIEVGRAITDANGHYDMYLSRAAQ